MNIITKEPFGLRCLFITFSLNHGYNLTTYVIDNIY